MTTTTLATAGTLGLTAAGGYLFGPLGAGAGALVGSFLFGGGTKVVEYRYFASFAVALGEGPAGAVTRIWAGDKLIARLRSSDHAKANHPKYRFRIYLGTEDRSA